MNLERQAFPLSFCTGVVLTNPMVVHYKGMVLTNPMVVHYKGVVLTNPMVVHYKGVVLTNPMVVHYKGVVLTNPMAFHSVEEWYTHNPKSLSFFLQRCGSCLNKTFKTSLPCVIPLTCVTTPEPREVFTPLNDASST